jgi:hypothetical protein
MNDVSVVRQDYSGWWLGGGGVAGLLFWIFLSVALNFLWFILTAVNSIDEAPVASKQQPSHGGGQPQMERGGKKKKKGCCDHITVQNTQEGVNIKSVTPLPNTGTTIVKIVPILLAASAKL